MSGIQQFGRKVSLLVIAPDSGSVPFFDTRDGVRTRPEALDLSQMQFQFRTQNGDLESPTNCLVRIYNLSDSTVQKLLKQNYSRLVLQAGYEGSFGVIFDGEIKQFRHGRENAKDTYLDLLAGDGDIGYNFAVVSTTLSAEQNTHEGRVKMVDDAFKKYGVSVGTDLSNTGGVIPNPRGKVAWGMARTMMSDLAKSVGCTWSIQNGKIQIIPLDGYLPGEAVKLTSATGLLGIPEATQLGIQAQCLLNPKIRVGGRVQIDNASIKQTTAGVITYGGAQVPFDQWVGIQQFATTTSDGFYRVLVAEHTGDTRGPDWYTDLTCLAIDPSSKKVKPYG